MGVDFNPSFQAAALIGLCGLLISCAIEGEEPSVASLRIGNQEWMPSNLSVNAFRNGDPIPRIRSAGEWFKAAEEGRPAWCYYEDNPANGAKYGKLYNYHAVSDSRGLAPEGWRIPDEDDWNQLADYLGGPAIAGLKLKSVDGWLTDNAGGNASGFSALPGGFRGGSYMGTNFMDVGKLAIWWTYSDTSTGNYPSQRSVNYRSDGFFVTNDFAGKGCSVRCLRD
jgi:uncharacterized protein (TIGR02145 family)